jgi:type IV pilus assembly protein PilQ
MKDRADFSRVVDGIPAIESREAKSEVLVENGGTVVIGGVFEEDEISSETQVPFLGDIPVVGNLFKSQARRGERRELLIFITPRIVSDALTLR